MCSRRDRNPTLESIRATVFRTEVETEWDNMLGHQLPFLPPFEGFWSELDEVFAWLGGRTAAPLLEPVPVGRDITPWLPARQMTTWRSGAPLEVIRFAGANRLKVVLDYWPERGRVGPRVVEPYSLRRTRDGTCCYSSETTEDSCAATASIGSAAQALHRSHSRHAIESTFSNELRIAISGPNVQIPVFPCTPGNFASKRHWSDGSHSGHSPLIGGE
jgi:hypothetical protein